MKTLLKTATAVATAIALLAPVSFALARGKRQPQPGASTEDTAKKKALDADYKRALNSVPDVKEKQDPWKTMR